MTPAQRRALQQCAKDGSLVIGGLDETMPRVRMDVCRRLHAAGLIRSLGGPLHCRAEFGLTDEGHLALQGGEK